MTITFQATEIFILTAIDFIITVIIIFRETEIMIIDKKIKITTGMQITDQDIL